MNLFFSYSLDIPFLKWTLFYSLLKFIHYSNNSANLLTMRKYENYWKRYNNFYENILFIKYSKNPVLLSNYLIHSILCSVHNNIQVSQNRTDNDRPYILKMESIRLVKKIKVECFSFQSYEPSKMVIFFCNCNLW